MLTCVSSQLLHSCVSQSCMKATITNTAFTQHSATALEAKRLVTRPQDSADQFFSFHFFSQTMSNNVVRLRLKPLSDCMQASIDIITSVRICRQKEAALAKRRDAGKASVVVTEKWDRKSQRYAATAVPFPFDSRDTYERSLRQPLGHDFNTNASFRCPEPQATTPAFLPLLPAWRQG